MPTYLSPYVYPCPYLYVVSSPISCTDASAKVGQVVAELPPVVKGHVDPSGDKSDPASADCGLHLHHSRHASLPEGLQRERLSYHEGLPASSLEYDQFLQCLPHHLQSPVWRVD